MDTIKTQGIVLSSSDYKEKDKHVSIFTLDYGIIDAVLKSVKSQNAKLKFAKEIFCFGEFIIAMPSKTITSVDVKDNFYDITNNLDKFYICCAILDIVKTVLPVGEKNPQLFLETLKAIGTVAYSNTNDKYVLIKYLLSIFQSMGYQLSLEKCSGCGQFFMGKRYLNLDFGEVTCVGCKTGNSVEISPKCHSCFKILANTDYDKIHTVKLAPNSEDEALNVLNINFDRRFNKKLNLL